MTQVDVYFLLIEISQVVANVFQGLAVISLQVIIEQVVLHLATQNVLHRQEIHTLHIVVQVELICVVEAFNHSISQAISHSLHTALKNRVLTKSIAYEVREIEPGHGQGVFDMPNNRFLDRLDVPSQILSH
jgi:ABC-type transport system involved in cytochrome bd biosynthesis fused ATPase/permease subunit